MVDIIIKNGRVIDGSGKKLKSADIAIENDQIVEVGDLGELSAERVIDATGKVISPGFIDIHSHADASLGIAPRAESLAYQGVTTVVTGQCGFSPAPLLDETREQFIKSLGVDGDDFPWNEISTFGSFLDYLEKNGLSINVEPLVGHGTIRTAVMGFSSDRPNEDQIEAMQKLVAQAMDEGAIGVSTGLIYPPGYFSETDELIEITKPVGERNGFYFSHVRGEGSSLFDSIREEIEIGRKTNTSVQHSHYKASGEENWDKARRGLEMIEEARAGGLDMTVDMYPYPASSNGLIDALPDWTREGGLEKTLKRLNDLDNRTKITGEMGPQPWEKMLLATSPNPDHVGRYVSELALNASKDPYVWMFDALLETGGQISRIVFGMSEENVKMQLAHEAMMIGTDGYGIPPIGTLSEGAPHPRSFGTFPRVLGKYVREEKILTLEEGVRKMTGFPAQKLRLADRGLVRKGYKADVVIFDPDTIIDNATFVEPKQYPTGIEYVLVNGKFIIDQGKHTHALPGKILTR
ncbi:MAG: D-aminoacylase [Anaerolineaceae bacterium]|nr:D-aminoacylase [Anaerolineaceae bacterium]